jgi:hypothetical protein
MASVTLSVDDLKQPSAAAGDDDGATYWSSEFHSVRDVHHWFSGRMSIYQPIADMKQCR